MTEPTLLLRGCSYRVARATGEEALSGAFRLDVLFDPGEGPPLLTRDLPGAEVTFTLPAAGHERVFHGLVRAARQGSQRRDRQAVRVEIVPRAGLLRVGRGCRSFSEATVVDVASTLLREADVPFRVDLVGRVDPRHYIAQYREDDAGFVHRLLAEEGIFTYFDHGEPTTLVLADDVARLPRLDAPLRFVPDAGLTPDAEVVTEVAWEQEVLPERVTVGSWSPRRPDLRPRESVGRGQLETYLPPGDHPELPDACRARAQHLLDALDTRRRRLVGLATSPRLAPGVRFVLQGSPFDGELVVLAASWEVHGLRWHGDGPAPTASFRLRFEAAPVDRRVRPLPRPPAEHVAGLQGGVVVGEPGAEIHPDDEGRVRVRMHWDLRRAGDAGDGRWMRVTQRATNDSLLLPRVGWTVLTTWTDGSAGAPEVLARIFDGEHRPPYALPEHRTRVVIKTATSPHDGSFNELMIEDAQGREEIAVRASRDLNVLAQNNASHIAKNDRRASVGRDQAVQTVARHQELVGGDQRTTVAGREGTEIAVDLKQDVGGALTETVGGVRLVTTGGAAGRNAVGARHVVVGAAQIDATVGAISHDSRGPFVHAVGGAHVCVAGSDVEELTADDARSAVGALRVESASASYRVSAAEDVVETVGGGFTLLAGGKLVDGSRDGAAWTIGGALTVTGTKLLVEATDEIQLRSGDAIIRVLPDAVEIGGPALALSGAAQMAAKTRLVRHN